MIVGVTVFELHLPASRSLKDKRRVVKSLIDRVHQRYRLSVAETGFHDLHQRAEIAVAAVTTMGAVGLPGQVSYISSIAPISIAMGSPIEALGLLIAVETLPDLVRTVGNVAMDIAVTATVAGRGAQPHLSEADALLKGDAP